MYIVLNLPWPFERKKTGVAMKISGSLIVSFCKYFNDHSNLLWFQNGFLLFSFYGFSSLERQNYCVCLEGNKVIYLYLFRMLEIYYNDNFYIFVPYLQVCNLLCKKKIIWNQRTNFFWSVKPHQQTVKHIAITTL